MEPDYRFTLANERTFLAWQRTGLGLLAAAVGLVHYVPALCVPGARQVLGASLGALALFTVAAGLHRWKQVDRAIRQGLPLPRQRTPSHVSRALLLLGLVTVTLVVFAPAQCR